MKILLAGATGFIGKPLIDALIQEKHELILLTRHPSKMNARPELKVLDWDGKKLGQWSEKAAGVDAVINLSGAGIADQRWTAARKQEILDSRMDSTRVLVEFMRRSSSKSKVFINSSAVGYYGNVPEGDVTENTPKGNGFLADICDAWEKEAKAAESLGIRVVLIRTGIVLEKGGGALAKMLFPFQIFAGGPLGSGRQWFPWIHRDDEIGLILFSLQNHAIQGAVNATAPNPLTMKDFCSTLGKVMHRPSWAPVPGFMLHILLGEMADMLLGGQKAIPQKALRNGYRFKYPELQASLQAILNSKDSAPKIK